MRVSINPHLNQVKDDNGVGRAIHAQFKYLPDAGIDLVGLNENPDIIATHINGDGLPRVDVLHCHGLYWTGDPGGQYNNWHHDANSRIVEAARRSLAITVPSNWVAEPFKRDMRIRPFVIGHGIDISEWEPAKNPLGYILWNKNRNTDVCDPTPALELANRGLDVVSTFAPKNASKNNIPSAFRVTGTMEHATMRELIRHAGIYLATTQETFGIGTVEALAAGVPVLGYRHGGTADIVEHQINGWLAEPGDISGLLAGVDWIRSNYQEARIAARETAKKFDWQEIAKEYALVYKYAFMTRQHQKGSVAVVITCYNYARFVADAIRSVLNQTQRPDELIVVDDGSNDNSVEIIRKTLTENDTRGIQVHIIEKENGGVASARNKGIESAFSDYVVCLDADDCLAPGYLETTSRALNADRGLGVAYTGLTIINEDGSEWGPSGWPPEFSWDTQATPNNPPSNCVPCAAMFRRDMWKRAGGYKQVYAPAEDTEFFTRGLSVGFRAKRVSDDHLFRYRSHGSGAHVTKEYKPIDTWHPWMKDKQYPLAVPSRKVPLIHSYSQPLVSVIIPVGPGHGRFLSGAIDSLLGQTCRDWELIVVNDSGLHLDLDQYPFAKVIESDKRHPGGSRNLGIEAATAPMVFFLDADDFIHPETLARMLDTLAKNGGYYVYCDWVAYSHTPDGEVAEIHQTPEYDQTDWLGHLPHSVTALIPTEWARDVGGFDETLGGWEEWDFYLKLALKGYCGTRLAEPLLGYRVTSGTIRQRSLAQETELKKEIFSRYKGAKIMGCCGGSGNAAQAVKNNYLSTPRSFAEEGEVIGQTVGFVRMRFTGDTVGAQTWRSRINRERIYRGAKDGINNYANVHPDDVDFMLLSGVWEVVQQPTQERAAPIPSGPVGPVAPTVPGMTTAEVRAIFQPEPPVMLDSPPVQPIDANTVIELPDGQKITAFESMPNFDRLPEGVTKLGHDEPEEPKKKKGRPAKERGYVDDASEF